MFEKFLSLFKGCCCVADKKIIPNATVKEPVLAKVEKKKTITKAKTSKSIAKKTMTKKKTQAKEKIIAKPSAPNRTPKNKN